jgi:hypothetical protein
MAADWTGFIVDEFGFHWFFSIRADSMALANTIDE